MCRLGSFEDHCLFPILHYDHLLGLFSALGGHVVKCIRLNARAHLGTEQYHGVLPISCQNVPVSQTFDTFFSPYRIL